MKGNEYQGIFKFLFALYAKKALQEKMTDEPRYNSAGRERRKYTPEIDARLREIVSEEHTKTRRMGAGHKQKLTNKQIHEILVEEGHDISLVTVNIELARIRQKQKEVFVRQTYDYGDRLEYDFGEVLLNCGEGMRTYHMAVLSSPCSDFRWLYLYTNQKKDVFLDSHVKFFEMVGGCYREVVYDNMKNVVSKFIGKNEKELNADLIKMAMYYGYQINVDELGYVSFDKAGCELLFNLLSNRHGKGSIVITTNLAFEQWENLFKDPVLTGAIIDRLAHKAHVLDISREQGGRFEETIAWMTNKQPAKIDDAD